MKRQWGVLFALGILVPVTAQAQVQAPALPSACPIASAALPDTPVALVFVNGECRSFSARPVGATGKLFEIASQSVQLGNGDGYFLSATFNTDPFASYVFGSVNGSGVTLNFDVFFSTPFVGGPYNYQSSEGTGSATATGAGTTGTISHNAGAMPAAYQQGYINLITPITGSALTGTSPCIVSPTCDVLDETSENGIPATPAAGVLTARLSYAHGKTGPGTSQATFNGGVEISVSSVPEPASVALMATGMAVLGLGAFARRRQS